MVAEATVPAPQARVPRLPVAPPEQWFNSEAADDPSPLQPFDWARLERRLDALMDHIDRRFDSIGCCGGGTEWILSDETSPPCALDTEEAFKCPVEPQSKALEVLVEPGSLESDKGAAGSTDTLVMTRESGNAAPALTTAPSMNVSTQGGRRTPVRSYTEECSLRHFSHIQERLITENNQQGSLLSRIVRSAWFDVFISAVVAANVLMFGVQVDIAVRLGDHAVGKGFDYFEYACTGVFTCELILRLKVFGLGYCLSRNSRAMFLMDLILVLMAWIDIVLTCLYRISTMGDTAFVGKIMKIIRVASARNLVILLLDMDSTKTGSMSEADFVDSVRRLEIKEYLDALSINLDDAANIFHLMDRNMDGTVDIVEFVQGMEKMQGEAKSSDIQILCMQVQSIQSMLLRLTGLIPLRPPCCTNPHLAWRNAARAATKESTASSLPPYHLDSNVERR